MGGQVAWSVLSTSAMTPSERPDQGAPASLDRSGADRLTGRGWRRSDAVVAAGILLALLVLAVAGAVTYRGMDRLLGDAEWVAHTHRVLEGLTRLHVHIVQAISSSRGERCRRASDNSRPFNCAM